MRFSDQLGDAPQDDVDRVWRNAESLIDRFDQLSKTLQDDRFSQHLADALREFTSATAIVIRKRCADPKTPAHLATIAKSGISILHTRETKSSESISPNPAWITDDCGKHVGLMVSRLLTDSEHLEFELRFDGSLMASHQQVFFETASALADITVPILLRQKIQVQEFTLRDAQASDMKLDGFYGGATPTDTYRSIVRTLASLTETDRVSLLRHRNDRCDLVATSVPTELDFRSDQIQSLREIVSEDKHVTVSDYQKRNDVPDLHIEVISGNREEKIVSIVFEQFSEQLPEKTSTVERLLPYREICKRAVRTAVEREQAFPKTMPVRLRGLNYRHGAIGAALLAAVMVLLCIIQIPLRLSVSGRIIAAKQTTIFSNVEGVVTKVHAADGDIVAAGARLVQLRSPELELIYQTLSSELATTQAKIATIRTFHRGQNDRAISAEAEVLKTEAKGIKAQLKIVQDQQDSLVLNSPHDGVINQWDAEESLSGRVVVVGQPLLRVIDQKSGWEVELEIPDRHSGYVIGTKNDSTKCSYRLRSMPTKTHQGKIDRIDRAAHVNVTGQSVVRALMTVGSEKTGDFRHGASVLAKVDCGSRSAAFVIFRSMVEWYREQAWL